MDTDNEPFEHRQDKQETHKHLEREIELPVTEEEIVAETREVDRGAVRVHKNVVEEQQTLEVPVTEDEVTVTRRDVDREIDPSNHQFGGDIRVPLMGEEVVVEKHAHVVEEVEIRKTPVTRTDEVTETVRREEVRIDNAGDHVEDDPE